ncbi:MAG: 5-(carboxyamino)imidazole ribonucleotide mutase [Pseudomonadota bacterium]
MKQVDVLIIIGSKSDDEYARAAIELLDEFGISYELEVASAHRNPDKVKELVSGARDGGVKVIIAMAGLAAHLPGVVASHTTLPVVGVPLPASTLGGLDSLLSISQMPAGVPVATMSLGKAGAKNAAIFSLELLAMSDKKYLEKLKDYRNNLAQ